MATSVIATNSSGVVQTSFTYTYTYTYTYDHNNRLTQAVIGTTTDNYAYDIAGNLCAKATSCASPTFTYNSANQLTASPAGSTYSYDGNGNETAGYSTIAGTSTAITPAYTTQGGRTTVHPLVRRPSPGPAGDPVVSQLTLGLTGSLLGIRIGTDYWRLR